MSHSSCKVILKIHDFKQIFMILNIYFYGNHAIPMVELDSMNATHWSVETAQSHGSLDFLFYFKLAQQIKKQLAN